MELRKAVPRNILFCIDISSDMNGTIGPSMDGGVQQHLLHTSTRIQTTLFLLKRYFLMNTLISPCDSYGIILMEDEASWYMDFTDDQLLIESAMDVLQASEKSKKFDTDSLLKTISEAVDLNDNEVFTHAIVFYGRTEMIPQPVSPHYLNILESENLTLDILYIHGSPEGRREKCTEVYKFWRSLECRVPNWVFEVGAIGKSSYTKFMAQLVAHPLQRGSQERMALTVSVPEDTDAADKHENQPTMIT